MKFISFELSMPSNNSWNGKWSGAEKHYVVVRSFRNTSKLVPKIGRYTYSFGDGWVAAVTVREVSVSVAKQFRKESAGFCGYSWMIDSIIDYGDIYAEPPKAQAQS